MNLSDSKVGMESMRDILKNLAAVTDDEAKAEQRYLSFDAFRKDTKDIGDIASLTGLDDYKKELETLKALVIDWKQIEAFKTAIVGFLQKANDLIKPFHPSKAFGYLDDMKPRVVALQKASDAFKNFPIFQKIQGSDKTLEPLSKATKGITEYALKETSLHRDSKDVSADGDYYEKIGTFKNVKSTSRDDENNIKAVLSIFETRIQTPVTFAFTSGFINGPSDLNEIPKDLDDAKMKILVSDPDSLLKAMEPLKSIGETAGVLEDTFGSSIDRKNALKYFLTERTSLVKFSDGIDTLVAAMKGVYGCNFSNLGLVSTLEDVKKLLEQARDLKTKMDQFSKIMAVSKFLIDNEHYFTYINKELALVDENKKEAFEGIQSRLKEAANHVAFFKCLQDVKDVELIPDGIQKIQNFRQMDLKPVEKGIGAVEDVRKAVKEFGKLEDAVNALPKMKNSMNPETKALEQLQNPSGHSMTIGGAARGIIAMKSAFDQKSLFAVVKNNLNLVAKEIQNAKNLSAQDVDNLEKLENVSKLFDSLESWTKEASFPEPDKLKDYSVIFLKARKVIGIDDLKKIRDSVGVLENSVQDAAKKKNLKELKIALDGLGEMKFSHYKKQFTDVDGTLEKLDLFFAQYSYELHPTTEYIEPSTSTLETTPFIPTTLPTTSTMLTTTAPVLFPVSGYIIIGGVVIVASVITSVTYCWVRGLYCFKPSLIKEIDRGIKPQKRSKKLNVVPNGEDFKNGKDKAGKSVKRTDVEPAPFQAPSIAKGTENGSCDFSPDFKKELNLLADLQMKEKEREENVDNERVVEDPELLFDAGEKFLAELFKQLLKHQKEVIGKDSEFLEDGTLEHYAKHIYQKVQTDCPKIVEEIPPNEKVQNRVQTSLTRETCVYLRPEFYSRCFFKDSYLNSNRFVLPNNQCFFMTETPTLYSKSGEIERRNVDKFWYMVVQVNCKAIVMLCSKDQELKDLLMYRHLQDDKNEMGITGYYPKKVNEVYYQGTNDKNKFTVTCEKEKQISENLVHRVLVLRYSETPEPRNARANFVRDSGPAVTTTETTRDATRSESTRTTGEDQLRQYLLDQQRRDERAERAQQFRGPSDDCKNIYRRIDHYVYTGYPKDSSPKTTSDIQEILEQTKTAKNVVVHCSDGVGRTGTFVCAALARQTLSSKINHNLNCAIDYPHILTEIRQSRNGAVAHYKDVAFLMMILVDFGYYVSSYEEYFRIEKKNFFQNNKENGKTKTEQKLQGRQHLCRYEKFKTSYQRILDPKVKLASEKKVEVEKPKKKQKKVKQEVQIQVEQDLDVDDTQEDMIEDPTQ
ncbi:unnamed protein product [Caenorhabditis brenneri]